MIKCKGAPDVTCLEHREGNGIAQGPVLVGMSREDLLGPLLLFRQYSNNRETSRQQPFPGERSPQLAQQQCVRPSFDVVGDKAWALLGRDLSRGREARSWS